ncbi:TIGR03862 family flavoprotein [uncultured Litoreibacter sp.]|uniref:TIGR03862 family flavoprotein n=1 Tax=uncultured Litoreibacter sp. TaxID=1392394 RepID=UPI00262DD0EF|nr:TIGR03862 family flavoprotein [uncultured Litoreibacter sp.]
MPSALVIGAGPAGLMAAEVLAKAGLSVTMADQKPSVARKFLMAGKSGLNLTKNEKDAAFLAAYGDSANWLAPMIAQFGVAEVMAWTEDLDQQIFTGSTGRVFPKAMKASPLLRAWLQRLDGLGVDRKLRWRWTGFRDDSAAFDTPEGPQSVAADVVVLALGGASWSKLGSDGAWSDAMKGEGVDLVDFAPSNSGVSVGWSDHMQRHLGSPVKNIELRAGTLRSRGEIVLSKTGIEGGGIYALSAALRDGAALSMDLMPDLSEAAVAGRLAKPRGKMSVGTYLRKALKLDPAKIGLLNEFSRPFPAQAAEFAGVIKALPIATHGLRPIDEAISTTGGIARSAVDGKLMLKAKPGVFVAGEMLDWDAPTGGYLITACLATGAWAGQAAADYAKR